MDEQIPDALTEAQALFADHRFNVCRLEATPGDGHYRLHGVVLDKATLVAALDFLRRRLPGVRWESDGVRILRAARPRLLTVATNLTGLQRDPSWLGEQQSQLPAGAAVEVLEEAERWAFVRAGDGYLGWMYRAYLVDPDDVIPTHQISAPFTLIYATPNYLSPVTTRLLAGTPVAAGQLENGWAPVRAGCYAGYADPMDLRPLDDTRPPDVRRQHLAYHDAMQYIGVPYLWGGTSVHGIDCSGFAQLMHRLAGAVIPRDADLQFQAGRPVEPPFAPGDLFFFGGSGDHRAISHVGISLGAEYLPSGWGMIHSSRSNNGVYTDDVQAVTWLRERFQGARRFLD